MNWERETRAFDEAFEASGRARPHYKTVLSILQAFSGPEIERRELCYHDGGPALPLLDDVQAELGRTHDALDLLYFGT